jgi:hypothetical protein
MVRGMTRDTDLYVGEESSEVSSASRGDNDRNHGGRAVERGMFKSLGGGGWGGVVDGRELGSGFAMGGRSVHGRRVAS